MGRRSIPIRADVTVSADVERTAGEIVYEWGGLDILANCAGIVSYCSLVDLPESEWDRIIEVNLRGIFLCRNMLRGR